MNEIILQKIQKYQCKTSNDYKNALKEIIQEIALLGLWRAKFFEIAAFYDGSALRILHGLNRFSEDLDFSLLKPNSEFKIIQYQHAIEKELEAFGFSVSFSKKTKTKSSAIESAFLKANTLEHFITLNLPQSQKLHTDEILKIRLEIDTNPPPNFETKMHYLLDPIPFSVRGFKESDLFAGKLHAILYREWKSRIKGRDWFDLIWFVKNDIPLHLKHLEMRMRQTSHWTSKKSLSEDDFIKILNNKIHDIDFEQAKKDLLPFIKDLSVLEIWSQEFFLSLLNKIKYE